MIENISHYKILKKLGVGGMGEVYPAEDQKLSRKVALKVLPTEVSNERKRLNRFLQEARLAAISIENARNFAWLESENARLRGETFGHNMIGESLVEKLSRKLNRRIRGISANAKKLLLKYDFPGNVRELENAIERAVVLGSSDWILPEDLPEDFLEIKLENEAGGASNYHEAVREKKKELIRNAFQEAKGSYVEAAKLLDAHPNYLHRLIRNLEIKEELEEKN